MPNHNFKDLTGQIFGEWKVIDRAENNGQGKAQWNCICSCGNTGVVLGNGLRRGGSKWCKHCGNKKHGAASYRKNTRLYRIWQNMKDRCNNPKNPAFEYYGGKGISIYKDWKDFSAFKKWALLVGYSDKLTIDRIDNSKGYNPKNCRWVPKYQQFKNQTNRNNEFIGVIYRKYKTHDETKNRHYVAKIQNGRKTNIYVGSYHTPTEAAFARDFYLMDNDLLDKHNGNFITKEKLQYKEI